LFIGLTIIVAFFVWELLYAPFPMIPAAVFSRDKRTMILTLLITFFSGGNYFCMLVFWPTQVYNVYGNDPIDIGELLSDGSLDCRPPRLKYYQASERFPSDAASSSAPPST
jgi:hypothetical protein